MNRTLVVPAVAGGLGVHAHVLLEGGNEIGHDLERNNNLGPDGSTSQKASVKSKGVCEIAQKFA